MPNKFTTMRDAVSSIISGVANIGTVVPEAVKIEFIREFIDKFSWVDGGGEKQIRFVVFDRGNFAADWATTMQTFRTNLIIINFIMGYEYDEATGVSNQDEFFDLCDDIITEFEQNFTLLGTVDLQNDAVATFGVTQIVEAADCWHFRLTLSGEKEAPLGGP